MTLHKSWIRNYLPHKVPIRLADNTVIYSEGIGSVVFRPFINGIQSRDIEFSKVLHVPALQNNLLAVLYLTKHKGVEVTISSSSMCFRNKNNDTLFTATINKNGIGYLDGVTVDNCEHVYLTSTLPLDLSLWHKRLGHHNYDDIKAMVKKNLVVGLKLDSEVKPDPICEPCLAGKMHANPFPSSNTRATELLELIHSDTHDVGVMSSSGYKYWVSFIDDFSRFKVLIPMKHKSDTLSAFKQFKAYAENLTGKRIKGFRDDKGGEYRLNEFNKLLESNGITRQHTCRNRPQQNGVAERANRLFSERIVSLLNESGLPEKFWVECLASLVHVTNLCPTSALVGKTPHEIWYGKKPDVSHLRVWGCLAYVHVQRDKRDKLGSHMEKCIFIGYPEGYKGWKFYNPETNSCVISERADFDERCTYNGKLIEPPKDQSSELDPFNGYEYDSDQDPSDDESVVDPIIHPDPIVPNVENPTAYQPIALRRTTRKAAPKEDVWSKYRSSSESDDDSEDEEDAFLVYNNASDPSSYKIALESEQSANWQSAMEEEFNWHLENGTWTLVELPVGKKAVGSMWVYRTKHNADGSIERFKARVVALGNFQRPGLDFFETFASTLRSSTIRIVLALAAIEDMELRSIDISYAFTNSDIDVEIYMAQPQGFKQGSKNLVCKLNKSLYGLRQSPRLWGETLAKALSSLGFNKTHSDASLYIFDRDGIKVIVPVFVDDITLASKSKAKLDEFVVELGKHFKLRDLGDTNYLLGIEITRDRSKRKLYLSQQQYVLNKLDEFKMSDCKPVGTPMLPTQKLSSDQSPKTDDEKAQMKNIPYINAVGSLMYLATMTRPDIAFAVGVLARFNSNPGPIHWKAVKHLFRYLKGTADMKLEYGPDELMGPEMFITYSDADHGGNKDNGKSTSGYLVKLGSGVVDWRSKLQPVVTRSTTEAEYIAAGAAGAEILWVQNLLLELGYCPKAPSKLCMDNQSAISVAKNPQHHGRMKHLDLCFYWLRDQVEKKKICPEYLRTDDMPADILTKSLPKPQVLKLRKLMGLISHTCGDS